MFTTLATKSKLIIAGLILLGIVGAIYQYRNSIRQELKTEIDNANRDKVIEQIKKQQQNEDKIDEIVNDNNDPIGVIDELCKLDKNNC